MNPEVLSAIIAGTVSLLVSSIIAAWTQRKKFESDYDVTLRAERLTEYRKLWQLTESIGWYGKHEITAETEKKLLADLDQWYFENGAGLLLSDDSNKVFEELLRALYQYSGEPERLRRLGTKLRAALAYDVGGRRRPLLRPSVHEPDLEKADVIASRPSAK
jgi:hypothetical protein